MQPVAAPRHFGPDGAMPGTGLPGAGLPGAGLPGDRLARMAARRAFVGLKQTFLEALHGATGPEASWLRGQVRGAEEPVDLWLLRASVFDVLGGPERRVLRQGLRRALDTLFPNSQAASGFSPL